MVRWSSKPESGMDLSLRIEFKASLIRPENIEIARYMLFDSRGRLVIEGDAEPGEDGQWKISLSSDRIAMLGFGANSLEVAVTSRRVAMPVFATHVFATVPLTNRALPLRFTKHLNRQPCPLWFLNVLQHPRFGTWFSSP
jgi:hypothetical protein